VCVCVCVCVHVHVRVHAVCLSQPTGVPPPAGAALCSHLSFPKAFAKMHKLVVSIDAFWCPLMPFSVY